MSHPATHSDSANEKFLKEYMPIAEFSAKKNIDEEKIISMIRAGLYSGRIKEGAWFVQRDELMKVFVEKSAVGSSSTNVFLKLLRGSYGLGFTFWVWGVCGGFALASVLLMPVAEGNIEILIVPFILIWFAYITMVFIGMWRSSKKISFWGIISKLFVIVLFFTLAFVILYITALLTADYPNH